MDGLGALDPALGDLGAVLGAAGGGLGAPMLESLAAAFGDVAGRIAVVFDDLHKVAHTEIVSDLWRLADMLPPHVHFVFSSRVDLKLGWESAPSAARAGGDPPGAARIRPGQHAAPARADHAPPVDIGTAETVVDRTEGWVAGIQLAGLSLRFRTVPRSSWDALAESDRLAIDYLSEEVLDAQDDERRRALLALSVLDEITPGLAEEVAGVADGDALLRALQDESMFVVALAGAPGRYRLHHLFRDLLRYRLRAAAPDAEASLRDGRALAPRAGRLRHRDRVPPAWRLLGPGAGSDPVPGREVYERGETATAARWLSLVPAAVRAQRIEAELLYGMLEGMSGRAALAEEVPRGIAENPAASAGVVLVARAFLSAGVQFRPHPEVYLRDGLAASALAEDTRGIIAPDLMHLTDMALLRVLVMISIGRAHLMMGDIVTAARMLQKRPRLRGRPVRRVPDPRTGEPRARLRVVGSPRPRHGDGR